MFGHPKFDAVSESENYNTKRNKSGIVMAEIYCTNATRHFYSVKLHTVVLPALLSEENRKKSIKFRFGFVYCILFILCMTFHFLLLTLLLPFFRHFVRIYITHTILQLLLSFYPCFACSWHFFIVLK